jgi:hypothetical protein
MNARRRAYIFSGSSLAAGLFVVGVSAVAPQTPAPLTIGSGRVSIAGSSNVHDYTAATTTVRVTSAKVAPQVAGASLWAEVVKPGVLLDFAIVVPAATLTSGDNGLDKNMFKALKTTEFPDITFKLMRLQPGTAPATLRAIGLLTISGVEREVAFDVKTQLKEAALIVTGEVALVMTDYGITPPKAMLGMLKTDPKVTVAFEVALAAANAAAFIQ